jgi:hypothetical protein
MPPRSKPGFTATQMKETIEVAGGTPRQLLEDVQPAYDFLRILLTER